MLGETSYAHQRVFVSVCAYRSSATKTNGNANEKTRRSDKNETTKHKKKKNKVNKKTRTNIWCHATTHLTSVAKQKRRGLLTAQRERMRSCSKHVLTCTNLSHGAFH